MTHATCALYTMNDYDIACVDAARAAVRPCKSAGPTTKTPQSVRPGTDRFTFAAPLGFRASVAGHLAPGRRGYIVKTKRREHLIISIHIASPHRTPIVPARAPPPPIVAGATMPPAHGSRLPTRADGRRHDNGGRRAIMAWTRNQIRALSYPPRRRTRWLYCRRATREQTGSNTECFGMCCCRAYCVALRILRRARTPTATPERRDAGRGVPCD
ncbi:hypothetical protein EVAR_32041_1 [Eumeta japonica]|uniref:Uncharacterized protein n=1 Tax=Eumeta variegata TaxID=151549 RepID=A0A4C1WQT9_EUMVA|nr:hypothetical protein EVAR_32041_1 [Eumeta japonica]